MPRQSAAAAKTFSQTGMTRAVLRPPPDLDQLEKEVFADIICGVEPNHFLPGDTALIAHLARNIVLARVAFGEMKAAGCISDDGRKWLQVLQHAAKELRATSRMLSLSPASYRQQPKPEDHLEEVSFYTRQRLLEGRIDDDTTTN
jgi:hypothetical protein